MRPKDQRKFCPLGLFAGLREKCLEEECSWWILEPRGEQRCAIYDISYLADLWTLISKLPVDKEYGTNYLGDL